jgi:uncharacterized repeat protein (TIGR02543 family)
MIKYKSNFVAFLSVILLLSSCSPNALSGNSNGSTTSITYTSNSSLVASSSMPESELQPVNGLNYNQLLLYLSRNKLSESKITEINDAYVFRIKYVNTNSSYINETLSFSKNSGLIDYSISTQSPGYLNGTIVGVIYKSNSIQFNYNDLKVLRVYYSYRDTTTTFGSNNPSSGEDTKTVLLSLKTGLIDLDLSGDWVGDTSRISFGETFSKENARNMFLELNKIHNLARVNWHHDVYEITLNTNTTETPIIKLAFRKEESIYFPRLYKEHFSFKGWYLENQFSEKFTATTMPDQSINLYAKWDDVLYANVYFDLNTITNIDKIYGGAGIAVVVTTDRRIFTWGYSEDGELGVGDLFIAENVAIEITHHFGLAEEEYIVHISTAADYVMAHTNTNRIFFWGTWFKYNSDNKAVVKFPTEMIFSNPTLLDALMLSPIKKILTMDYGYFILLESGFWAYNGSNSLFEKFENYSFQTNENITDIFGGANHFFVVTSNKRIIGFGDGSNGQLGNGEYSTNPAPLPNDRLFIDDEILSSIVCGDNFTILLTSKGRVFTFGNSSSGQLGNGNSNSFHSPIDITSRFQLTSDDAIESIYARADVASAVTKKGNVFLWGAIEWGEYRGYTNTPQQSISFYDSTSGTSMIHNYSLGYKGYGDDAIGFISTTNNQLYTFNYMFTFRVRTSYYWFHNNITRTQLNSQTLRAWQYMHTDYLIFNSTVSLYMPQIENKIFDAWLRDPYGTATYSNGFLKTANTNYLFARWYQ